MRKTPFADPTLEIAFTKLFTDPSRSKILIGFLNAVMDLKEDRMIKEVTILPPNQFPRIHDAKEVILDIQAVEKNGRTFIVEMQVRKQEYFKKRATFYSASTYLSQLKSGVKYTELKPVVFIGILDFVLLQSPHYFSRHIFLDTLTHAHELTELEFYFIELPKFDKSIDNLNNLIDKWTYFLKFAKELDKIPSPLNEVEEIQSAFEVIEKHQWSDEELHSYTRNILEEMTEWDIKQTYEKEAFSRGHSDGYSSGHSNGLQEGTLRTKIEIAKKLHKQGLTLEQIVDTLSLSPAEITSVRDFLA